MPTGIAVGEGVSRLADLSRARLDSIDERVEAIARQCSEREDDAGARRLVRTVQLLCAQGRRLVDDELQKEEPADDPGGRESRIRNCLIGVDNVCDEVLEALVYPPGRDIAALIQPFIRLARSLTDKTDTELVFETVEAYGYEVWPNVFEPAEDNVRSINPQMKSVVMGLPRLAVIYTPARADSDVFLHSVIAHEIAHLALAPHPSDADLEEAPLISKVFEETLQRYVSAKEIRSGEVLRLKKWFEELLCDALASRMIGPAFFLALFEFLSPTHQPDDEQVRDRKTHPPAARRLERLIAEADRFFLGASDPSLADAQAAMQEYMRLLPDATEPTDPDQLARTKRDWRFLEDVLGQLDDHLDAVVGKARYWEETFQADLPLVWDKIGQRIAPAELIHGRGVDDRARQGGEAAREQNPDRLGLAPPPSTPWSQPLDWRSILNGGFLHWLHESNPEEASPKERREMRQKATHLIRGSVELSELHRQMIGLRDQLDVLNDPKPPQDERESRG
jgi:hypothetical protein